MTKLRFLRDADPRFKWLSLRVGIFTGIIVVCVAALVLLLGVRQGLFSSKEKLHFVAESGSGLLPGMQVRLSGFRIGVADEVHLNEQAKVDVTLLIESQYMKWIRADSIAILQQEGLIGDHYLEIARGEGKGKPLEDGGVIEFVPALGMADIAQDLRNRTLPIIDSVQETLNYLNDPNGDIRKMVANVQQLTAEVRGTREKIDTLLTRVDGVIDGEGRATLKSADQLLRRADSVASEINSKLPPVLEGAASIVVSVDATAKSASATMSVLQQAVEESAPQLPGVMRNADELLYGSRETLDGLRNSWPLNRVLQPVPLIAPPPESRR